MEDILETVKSKGSGKGWKREKDPTGEGHSRAGKIGGRVTSQDRAHMAEIGRKGGKNSSRGRNMKEIGKLGGLAKSKKSPKTVMQQVGDVKEASDG